MVDCYKTIAAHYEALDAVEGGLTRGGPTGPSSVCSLCCQGG